MKITHRVDGICTIQSGLAEVMFDPEPQRPRPLPPPTGDPHRVREDDKEPPEEIHLGPLPPPPWPMGVVITRDIGDPRRRTGILPMLSLERDIVGGRFSVGVVDHLRSCLGQQPAAEPFRVEAYLPAGYSVDVELLSCHVADLGHAVGRQIEMTLGTHIAGR